MVIILRMHVGPGKILICSCTGLFVFYLTLFYSIETNKLSLKFCRPYIPIDLRTQYYVGIHMCVLWAICRPKHAMNDKCKHECEARLGYWIADPFYLDPNPTFRFYARILILHTAPYI